MSKLWFRNKTYGYGRVPCSWEGRVSLLIFIAILTVWIIYFTYAVRETSHRALLMAAHICFAAMRIFSLLSLWALKGEKPRWQWGKKNND